MFSTFVIPNDALNKDIIKSCQKLKLKNKPEAFD